MYTNQINSKQQRSEEEGFLLAKERLKQEKRQGNLDLVEGGGQTKEHSYGGEKYTQKMETLNRNNLQGF